jgi:hypothetical protein
MDRIMRRVATTLLVAALAAGCKAVAHPAEAERGEFGDMAVVVARDPSPPISRPTTGWLAGLGAGAVRGVGAIVVFAGYGAGIAAHGAAGGGEAGVFIIAGGAAAGAAVGVLYTPVSIVSGGTTAASGEDVEKAEIVIRPMADDPAYADAFVAHFVEDARTLVGRQFVSADRATTRVELRILSIAGGRTWDWITLNRPFEIVVEASVRVVRAADGHVIWEKTETTPDSAANATAHTYVEWAADGGALLRREIDLLLGRLAWRFARTVFAEPDAPPPKPPGAAELRKLKLN